MSDLRVNCPHCEQEYSIPPHMTVMGLKCLECGTPMAAAASKCAAERPPRAEILSPACQMAGGAMLGGVPLDPGPGTDPDPSQGLGSPPHPGREASRDVNSWISGVAFLLVGGFMVGFQFLAPHLVPYARDYLIVRNLLTAAAVILMAHSAAQDGIFRGLLCIVFPPYLLLYATSQEESGWLRGLFLGVVLGLCAEAFLLPDKSLILQIGPVVSTLIERVENWMALASRPPV